MVSRENKQPVPSKPLLRKEIVNISMLNTHPACDWVLETPAGIRDKALKQVYTAIKTQRTLGRTHWRLKYRRKKDRSQTIKIDARDYNSAFIRAVIESAQLTLSEEIGLRKRSNEAENHFDFLATLSASESLPPQVENEFEIMRTWTGEYFFLLPAARNIQPQPVSDSQATTAAGGGCRRVVAIDPGVRTFATCYDPSGTVYEVGAEDRTRLCKLSWSADKLAHKIKSGAKNHRQRYRLKRRLRRTYQKRRNLVDELHHQLAVWLCREFDDIIITTYRGSILSRRLGRRLNTEVTRQMLTWSYYRFKQFLVYKAQQTGKRVFIVEEPYTSRTCGECGILKDPSSSKTFACKACNAVMDRDFNGARNILLRTLSV